MLLKKGLSFTATGIFDRNLYFPQDVDVRLLDGGTRDFWIGWNEVDIALDGSRPSLLNLPGILSPTAQGCTVEAGNHRYRYSFLGPTDVIQISFGAHTEFVRLGEKAGSFRKTVRAVGQVLFEFDAFLAQLLLKE